MIDTGLAGLEIDVGMSDVIINDKVKLLRPKSVSSSQWEAFWFRLDKDHTNNEDGHVVVDLGD